MMMVVQPMLFLYAVFINQRKKNSANNRKWHVTGNLCSTQHSFMQPTRVDLKTKNRKRKRIVCGATFSMQRMHRWYIPVENQRWNETGPCTQWMRCWWWWRRCWCTRTHTSQINIRTNTLEYEYAEFCMPIWYAAAFLSFRSFSLHFSPSDYHGGWCCCRCDSHC